MSECSAEYTKLPSGWDRRYDQTSGKCYYVNHITKAMQIEDPRIRYKQLQNERCSTESIPMQPLHGSPYHVYPASIFPAVKAFQGPNSSLQSVSASPLLSTKGQIQMEMSPILKQGSPQIPPRMGNNMARRQTIQETSFSNNIDTDAVVAKINNMFPTASDDHIRLLLKKYYNREAVVISALQVEKNPITMPGPFATPPAQRHLFHSNSAFQMTPPARRFEAFSRTDSPIPGRPSSVASILYGSPRIGDQYRSSPKPHSSPKMKLRYLKNVFPKADETMLLDILANSDNNVQKASETLIEMGYQKRDMAPPKLSNRMEASKREEIPINPKVLTLEEKNEMKIRLQQRYKNIAERIITMALESVNFSEDRATQILQIVQQEDETKAKKEATANDAVKVNDVIPEESQAPSESRDSTAKTSGPRSVYQPSSSQAHKLSTATATSLMASSESHYNIRITGESPHSSTSSPTEGVKIAEKSRFRCKRDLLKNSPKETKVEDTHFNKNAEFKSIIGRIETNGHNSELSKGPDDTLLLADYITWNGANPDISIAAQKNVPTGHDPNLLSERNFTPRGHNADLCKGPNANLSNGSIYSQLNQNLAANVKCN